jgi:hypothetical protein
LGPDDLKRYPPFYANLALKLKERIPKLPIHTPEERQLFQRNVNFYSLTSLENRRASGFDAKRMCADWNGGTLQESCRFVYPAVSRDIQVFKKTPEQLEDYFKVYHAFEGFLIVKKFKRAVASKDMFSKNRTELLKLQSFNDFMGEDYLQTFDVAVPLSMRGYISGDVSDSSDSDEEIDVETGMDVIHNAKRIRPKSRRSTHVPLQSVGMREFLCQTCKNESCPGWC